LASKWEKTDGYTGEMIRKEKICPQLKEIDELWKKVSIRLGFSAQRKIWKESQENYPAFTEKVGWVINESTWIRNLSYELKTQKTSKNGQLEDEDIKEGHLPALWNQTVKDPTEGPSSGEDEYKAFFKALQFCKIGDDPVISTIK
jgi:GUN4-like